MPIANGTDTRLERYMIFLRAIVSEIKQATEAGMSDDDVKDALNKAGELIDEE